MNIKNFTPYVIILSGLLMSCNYEGNKAGLHWFLDMHHTLAVKSQTEDYTTYDNHYDGNWQQSTDSLPAWGGPGASTRVPPEGTVPRNYQPYPYSANDFDSPARELRNPVPATRDNLERGKNQYEAFCAVCHGYLGEGDGPVTPRFPDVPAIAGPDSLVDDWEDGRLYHIITAGRARMGGYAAKVKPEDRWAIIHYIRLLQESQR